jgi:hypothetical protein
VTGREFGRFAFYIWRMQMDFDDLVIERNAIEMAGDVRTNAVPRVLPFPAEPAADTVMISQGASLAEAGPAAPKLYDVRGGDGMIGFRWNGDSRCVYEVQACNALLDPAEWAPVRGWEAVKGSGDVMQFSAPASTAGHTFYRVVVRPAVPDRL